MLLVLMILIMFQSGWTKLNVQSKDTYEKRIDIDDIYIEFLEYFHALYPRTTKIKVIGKSLLGRDIYAFEVGHSNHRGGTVVIEGGLHGNEWQSVNMPLLYLRKLLQEDMGLLLWLRVVFLPLVNPDGYEEAVKNSSYNLNVNPNSRCPGINLAVNFPVGPPPKFTNCENYPGESYGSEIETQNLMRYIEELGDVKLYITCHATSSFVAHPFAFNDDPHVSASMADNMHKVIYDFSYEKDEQFGTLGTLVKRKFGGNAIDWACLEANVTYCIHLSVNDALKEYEDLYDAYYEGIKYAIIQLQITEVDVGEAFVKEMMSKKLV